MRSALENTWNYIGNDYIACFDNEKAAYDTFGNDEGKLVAEACIDADRLRDFGGFSRDHFDWLYDLPTEKLFGIAADCWNGPLDALISEIISEM